MESRLLASSSPPSYTIDLGSKNRECERKCIAQHIKSLLLSICILSISVLAGFLLSRKILPYEPSLELLKIEIFVAATIFLLQISLYSKAKTHLFYQLLFIGCFGFSLILMLVSLFLPLL